MEIAGGGSRELRGWRQAAGIDGEVHCLSVIDELVLDCWHIRVGAWFIGARPRSLLASLTRGPAWWHWRVARTRGWLVASLPLMPV